MLCKPCKGRAVRGEGGGHEEAGRVRNHELAEGALRGGRGGGASQEGTGSMSGHRSELGHSESGHTGSQEGTGDRGGDEAAWKPKSKFHLIHQARSEDAVLLLFSVNLGTAALPRRFTLAVHNQKMIFCHQGRSIAHLGSAQPK